MCGRYRLTKRRLLEIEEYYGVEDIRDLDLWEREFNIPPGEMAPIIFDHKGSRHLVQALWGLRSSWTESPEQANRVSTFNAKAETLIAKPAFKDAFLRRRCIVPAEAFYEWVGPKSGRQPLSIGRVDGRLLSLAGLFNYWKARDSAGPSIATFTVVTTTPNQWMARIHNRMPALLPDNQINAWLDPTIADSAKLAELLKAPPENFLECYPVSKEMSSARVDHPACVEKIELDYLSLLNPPPSPEQEPTPVQQELF